VLEVLYHHASLVGLGFNTPPRRPKNVEFFVCLSVRHACEPEFVCTISPRRGWSTETILIPMDMGRLVVVHPCSAFSDCCQLATPQNANVQKAAKFWVLVGDVRCGRYKSTKKPSFWRLHYLNWPNLITVGVNNTPNRLPLSTLLYSYNQQQLMIMVWTG